MRHHARRMRRSGLQPMIVINSDDQLPDLIPVIILRALWRYRSELAPITLALALFVTALTVHLTHPRWWVAILITTIVVGGLLVLLGHRVGLAVRAERLYAVTVVLTSGAWLTVATALGVLYQPLPLLLCVAMAVLGVPWWANRRRRARVQVERKLAAWPQISQSVGLAGSRVQSAIVDLWGWRARFGLARGQTIQDVIAKIPALESALGTFRGAVRVHPTPDDRANRVELRILNIDPHADAIPWPGPSVGTITEPIEFGPFEDAAPARVLFLRRHGLFGGATGSGKSGGINVLMGNLSACRDVVIWAIDLKRGMELRPWAQCIDRLATTPEQARILLRDAVAVLEARADHLAATGRRVWEPTPDMPALVIVIDEYAELTEFAAGATAYSDSIARRGRAVSVQLIAATQRPTQKAMGRGAVRSQMDVRLSFRVRERKDVDLILGQGMLGAGWNAQKLDAPGKFLVSAPEHSTPRRARAYLLTDETVSQTATQNAHDRPRLDEISQRALDEREDRRDVPTSATGAAHEAVPEEIADVSSVRLHRALDTAPDSGVSISELVKITNLSRRTVYRRLSDLVREGRVTQVSRGHYRAADLDRGHRS